jgi:hypothetical protein
MSGWGLVSDATGSDDQMVKLQGPAIPDVTGGYIKKNNYGVIVCWLHPMVDLETIKRHCMHQLGML